MCKMRFDLGVDVESIEGNNKSKKHNIEFFCTPSQDCFQQCYEKRGTIQVQKDTHYHLVLVKADTVYNLNILD